MMTPLERHRGADRKLPEKSPEVLEIEHEIAALEAQRARIDRRIAEQKARLEEAKRTPERVEYADFSEPVPLPGEWAIEAPNKISEGRRVPGRFHELVATMRRYGKSSAWTQDLDALIEDFQNMAAGRVDAPSKSSPESTLAEIQQAHYPDWSPQDFRLLLAALPEKKREEQAETFDRLADALTMRIQKASRDSHSYFTPDNFNRRMNEALVELVKNVPRDWLNGNTAERINEAELDEDISPGDLSDEWFTADEGAHEILFEGEPVARYQPGGDDYYGGSIQTINERKLRSALEAFLRKTLTHAPRERA